MNAIYKPNLRCYDANLLGRIDSDIVIVRLYHTLAFEALLYKDEFLFRKAFNSYQDMLKDYLKLVSVNVYVYLRHALANDPLQPEFGRIEAQAYQVYERIAKHLVGLNYSADTHKKTLVRALMSIDRLLDKQYKTEQKSLYPIYQNTALITQSI